MTLPQLPAVLAGYQAPLLALAVAGLGASVAHGKWAGWAGLPGAAGTLAGWVALLPLAGQWRAALSPRGLPDALLLPALVVAVLCAAGPRMPARLARGAPWAVTAFIGWWLATSLASLTEFWRVWAVFALVAWLLARGVAGQVPRAWAAALAGLAGLALTRSPPPLGAIGLVLAAAWAPAAVLAVQAKLAPVLLVAAALVSADLAAGRLQRGRLNAVDLACLAALGAPWLVPLLAARTGRYRTLGPALAAIGAAAVAAGAAWAGSLVLGR